ncbi:MAG: hypothetical protein LBT75_01465 [Bacilli bacterium]|nr:hypothetical protein [Bacilli bacterium]
MFICFQVVMNYNQNNKSNIDNQTKKYNITCMINDTMISRESDDVKDCIQLEKQLKFEKNNFSNEYAIIETYNDFDRMCHVFLALSNDSGDIRDEHELYQFKSGKVINNLPSCELKYPAIAVNNLNDYFEDGFYFNAHNNSCLIIKNQDKEQGNSINECVALAKKLFN